MKKYKKLKYNVSDEEVGKYEPISFSDVKKEWLKDPKFRKSYDDLEPEYSIIRAILRKRIESKMSQKDLAKKLGTKQSAISRLESGNYNPTLSFLKKLSSTLGGKLEIKI
ncbi:MAG: transcriptional regulator, XRE family [Parcubacteria group bacterium GW2011_GWC1_35_8]|uniref:Helix-turn-helix domain protein n=1 Tax=Candidatus Nomurabacteria bacterium GW2011_GWC2_35_8 TaxID=1618752 RepID=A0A0G0FPL9_9BACT|nr:MAG: transcriptional regulator, XRE family [Parcubacteria group bacterium GW2011_GWC1_35_8]KKP89400.1 MAG: Helix-turn-helix domain protein [Candidatus Nomurabacteria bacterium GW2011_GWC2_35_8]